MIVELRGLVWFRRLGGGMWLKMVGVRRAIDAGERKSGENRKGEVVQVRREEKGVS